MIDIIIADTQELIIEGLKTILHERYNILGTVSSRTELMETLTLHMPDLIIMDYSQLDFKGIGDLQEIKKLYPDIGIVILTGHINRNDLIAFNNAGIKNILHKNVDRDELVMGLEAASKNKNYFSGELLELMMPGNDMKVTDPAEVQLTPSEVEIVRLIAEGLTTKEIAQKKFLSFHTVMTHRKNIFRKTGVSNVSELIRFAIRNGIIDNIEYYI